MKISKKNLRNLILAEVKKIDESFGKAMLTGIQAGQAVTGGTEYVASQAAEKGIEVALSKIMSPAVAARVGGVVGGVMTPSELGDGTITGRFKATLEKHFPDLKEDDRGIMAGKLIMYNRLTKRPLLSFPPRAKIHQLYNTPIEKFEQQFKKLKKQPETKPVSEQSLRISKSKLQQMINEELRKIIEGPEMGQISVEDLVAEITITLENLLQELRPDPETAKMAFAQIKDSIDVILNKSLAGAMRVSSMVGEQLGDGGGQVRDPISPSGQMVTPEELINDIKAGMDLCYNKLESPEEIDYELVILLGNALKRVQALTGEEYP